MIISHTDIQNRINIISDDLIWLIYDARNDQILDELQTRFQFSDDIKFLIEKKLQYVFLGFLRIKDLFEELVQDVKLDSKTALVIFQELDQKIFANHRAEIEENYRNFQVGVRVAQEEIEPLKIQEQIFLRKENSPNVVDLSLKDIPIEKSKIAQEMSGVKFQSENQNVYNAHNNSTVPFSGSVPISSVGSNVVIINKIPDQPRNSGIEPPPPANHPPLITSESGPVVIHKVEEAQSVGQMNAVKGYKQMSFGSFKGSFGAPQNKASNISQAEIEIPNVSQAQNTQSQSVPFSVKKYDVAPSQPQQEEVAKVVHYTFEDTK